MQTVNAIAEQWIASIDRLGLEFIAPELISASLACRVTGNWQFIGIRFG